MQAAQRLGPGTDPDAPAWRAQRIDRHARCDTVPGASEGDGRHNRFGGAHPALGADGGNASGVEMERAGIHTWSEVEVIRVTSASGITGWGETIQNYTWGRADIDERVIGRSPFDCTGTTAWAPGCRWRCWTWPASWPACRRTACSAYRCAATARCRSGTTTWRRTLRGGGARGRMRLGYTCMKIKTRPWWDVHETIARISEATPPWVRDRRGLERLSARRPDRAAGVERAGSGVREDQDLRGADSGRRHRRQPAPARAVRTPIAHHYDEARQGVARAEYCDGYVIGGGIAATIRAGHFAGSARIARFS